MFNVCPARQLKQQPDDHKTRMSKHHQRCSLRLAPVRCAPNFQSAQVSPQHHPLSTDSNPVEETAATASEQPQEPLTGLQHWTGLEVLTHVSLAAGSCNRVRGVGFLSHSKSVSREALSTTAVSCCVHCLDPLGVHWSFSLSSGRHSAAQSIQDSPGAGGHHTGASATGLGPSFGWSS